MSSSIVQIINKLKIASKLSGSKVGQVL